SGRRRRWCGYGDRSTRDARRRALPRPVNRQTFAQRPIFGGQESPVGALLFGKLEEDLFAFGILEAFAVLLEELVRIALAADPDEQCLQVVHAGAQPFGAFGKDAVRGAFEKEKGRARFEQAVLGREVSIPPFERREMLFLFAGELLEHAATARIGGHRRRSGVELKTATLRGNRD